MNKELITIIDNFIDELHTKHLLLARTRTSNPILREEIMQSIQGLIKLKNELEKESS